MINEMVFVLEPDVGRVTVEISQAPAEKVDDLAHDLGSRVNLNCAKPSERPQRNLPILQSQCASPDRTTEADKHSIWLYRLYHNSVVDGPGRRSVAQVAGCSIRCPGFIYSLEGAKYDFAHERHQQRTAYFWYFILV